MKESRRGKENNNNECKIFIAHPHTRVIINSMLLALENKNETWTT